MQVDVILDRDCPLLKYGCTVLRLHDRYRQQVCAYAAQATELCETQKQVVCMHAQGGHATWEAPNTVQHALKPNHSALPIKSSQCVGR